LRFDARTGRFQKYLGGASAYYVDASADGLWLTWVSYPEGALWKSREDGTQRLRITPLGWRAYLPRWSPDGTSIAFAGASPAETSLQIFRISADGGEPQLVVRHVGQNNLWDACWLPDGRAIVYSYQTHLGIYRVDLQTREV
jgi:tricorn protease-like protein